MSKSTQKINHELINIQVAIELDKGKKIAEVAEKFGLKISAVKAVARELVSKNQQKKKSLRILFGHAEISFLLPGGLGLRRHWVFQLCFLRVFFFPACSSNLLQFLRRVAPVITQ